MSLSVLDPSETSRRISPTASKTSSLESKSSFSFYNKDSKYWAMDVSISGKDPARRVEMLSLMTMNKD